MVTPTCRIHQAARCRRSCGVNRQNALRFFPLSLRWACLCLACIWSNCYSTSNASRPLALRRAQLPPQPRYLPQRPPGISSRRALSPSKVRRPAKPTSRSRPLRKRRSLPRPSPKSAGPNRFIPKNSSHAAARQPCSNHTDAENLPARDSGRQKRTGLQWLDRSFGPAADLSRPARDGKSAGAQRRASHEKWSGPRGGRRRCYL